MASTEVSATRLYLGNLPKGATKQDVEAHFNTHGTGEITEIKLMNGFGFIEYKDAMDARDVVPGTFHMRSTYPLLARLLEYRVHGLIFNACCSFPYVMDRSWPPPFLITNLTVVSWLIWRQDGSDFMGERLTVQFARGSRQREGFGAHERSAPRPRRTPYRMQITGLPNDTSWQDLKDFARQSSLDVVYSETGREGNGRGFVEFETAADLKTAVEKLDNREFKGQRVSCVADISLHVEIAALVRPKADDPMGCHPTATIVDLRLVAIVLGVIAMIIAIEVLAVTTMMIAVIGRPHVAVQSMSMGLRLDAMKTPIDGGIIRLRTRMSTDVPMTVPHETFLPEKGVMVRAKVAHTLVRIIGEEATGKHTSLSAYMSAPPYVL
ncbi:hypothetical protein F5Y09DRAFT_342511 [Xylaria sp. FL1042]|nr:hypothetical protein F5Y09DRAFT_342511 [Xylaria sp. FL1042]